ncbi:MAG: CDP-archaeol synthase [Clostridia bacterium]|nr:CDP-archaeol synthase [Clostridia bacterium]
MKTRIIAGTTLFFILVAVVLVNGSFPLILNILIALMSSVGVHEFCKAYSADSHKWLHIPSIIVAALVPFAGFVPNGVLLVYALYTLAVFFAVIRNHEELKFSEMIPVYGMTVIIPNALNFIVELRDINSEHGMFFAMLAILGPWIADSGAYFTGSFFGKHKLCPVISPKKTVEGFIGGIIVSVLAMLVAGLVFDKLYIVENLKFVYIALAICGVLNGFVSVVGDLSFSIIKREKGIKDYGKLIPGHGGILDRFDSVIFVAPFVYLVVKLFGI